MLYPKFGCVETRGGAVAITEQAGMQASKLGSKLAGKYAGNYVSWQACKHVSM